MRPCALPPRPAAADAEAMTDTTIDHESEEWLQARKRVADRRDFGSHVVVFVVVNACLTLVWAITSAGYFWPAWFIGCWGIGLLAGSSVSIDILSSSANPIPSAAGDRNIGRLAQQRGIMSESHDVLIVI